MTELCELCQQMGSQEPGEATDTIHMHRALGTTDCRDVRVCADCLEQGAHATYSPDCEECCYALRTYDVGTLDAAAQALDGEPESRISRLVLVRTTVHHQPLLWLHRTDDGAICLDHTLSCEDMSGVQPPPEHRVLSRDADLATEVAEWLQDAGTGEPTVEIGTWEEA